MAPAKFDRIISVSSEDPAFPAENLLKNAYSDKKWKSKSQGENQISVVIQLEKAERICGVDIGNYGTSFVEILVSKSSKPDDFKVLVAASALMTLQEAKLGSNLSGVRFFKEDNLVKEVASEKWDRIQVVCSQPYNKHIQYGLSFIVVHTANGPSTGAEPSIGQFQLKKKEDSDGLTIGSLFAKRKDNGPADLKGAAAIRAASTSGIIEKKMSPSIACRGLSSETGTKLKISDNVNSVNQESPDSGSEYEPDSDEESDSDINPSSTASLRELRKKTPKGPKADKKTQGKEEKRRDVNGTGEGSSSSSTTERNKRRAEEVKENSRKKANPKPRLEKPFNKLFEGVVFTISGFQNPYRSELRNKALAMGAKYRPDWDNICTHLLCAFPNTPKYDQVLGHGKIITKDWIEACYNRRMRLPWRRYALNPPDKAAPESEEEIFEYVERAPSPVDNRRRISPGPSSGEDTEDEIERILQIQAKQGEVKGSDNDVPVVKNDRVPTVDSLEAKPSSSDSPKIKPSSSKELSSSQGMGDDDEKRELNKNKNLQESIRNGMERVEKEKPLQTDDVSTKGDNKSPKKRKPPKKEKVSPISEKEISTVTKKLLEIRDIPESPYDVDTEEEDEFSDAKQWNLPPLTVIFEGIKFLVDDDLDKELQKKLRRYIFAHKGCLMEESDTLFDEVHIVITESKTMLEKVKMNCPNVIGLRPEWIWKAHDESRLPPTRTFEIKS